MKIVLALGYFDSVHIGHRALLEITKRVAAEYDAVPAVFTFSNNPAEYLSNTNGSVYTYNERIKLFKEVGIFEIVAEEATAEYLNTPPEVFLNALITKNNICAVVVGSDYTCGKGATYKSTDVRAYLERYDIKTVIVDLIKTQVGKVSTTLISTMLTERGNMREINLLLGRPYFVEGIVVHGKARGRTLGFRTANIVATKQKLPLKTGVYATFVYFDTVRYKAITNVGPHPTFNDGDTNFESYIFNFDGDIYDKEIRIEFIERLRDVIKFDTPDMLVAQIATDKQKAEVLLDD